MLFYLQVGIERYSELSLARSVPALTADFPRGGIEKCVVHAMGMHFADTTA